MAEKQLQTWDLWYPKAAATGLPFARGRLDPTRVLWVHAAPDFLTVQITEGDKVVASGTDLERTGEELPTTRLWIEDGKVRREDRWPTREDLGSLIILPGGEVGTLVEWWNAEDGSEWRWRVEFYNHR
ncbi:MAG TPA: hypothetical protein VFR15_10185 [Chloroflexia bacterium]|nr:hypothetical protein [Chloroflexia bacterium]